MQNKSLREQVLKEMRESVGSRDPIEFFKGLVTVFEQMFDEIDLLHVSNNDLIEKLVALTIQNEGLQIKAALAIKWEPALALHLLDSQIEVLRQDRDLYHTEISAFKKARMEDSVTQNYESFCKFWQDTLGYHPFLNYNI